jgi:spore coat polysaccharide biosynthesis protein SpsF
VATTLRREDDALVALGQRLGIHVLRGPTDDVLSRFAEIVAARPDVDMVVRATADNPFVDIGSASRLLTAMGPTADYAVEEGLPIGGTVEVMRAEALLRAHREATSDYDREHVTPWLKRADAGGALRLQAPLPCRAPSLRLTVDTLADLVTARHLADALTRAGWDPRLAPLPYVIASARAYMTQEVA